MRSTDHARLLLRRAQFALAGLAVPVSLVVGMIAADPTTADIAPAVSRVVEQVGSPWISGRALERDSIAGLARAEAVTDDVASASASAAHRPAHGSGADPTIGSTSPDRGDSALLVGLITLVLCWAVLLLVGAIWRYRLAVRDYRDWTDGWARVEPRWSNRTV